MPAAEVTPGGIWSFIPEWINQVDRTLYQWLSNFLPSSLVETLITLTENRIGVIVLALGIIVFGFWKKTHWRYWILGGFLGLLCVDWLVDSNLKPLFGRVKPYQSLSTLSLDVVALSFPSSHAANFAFLGGFHLKDKPLNKVVMVLMFAVSALRVICGRHFPLDVIGGMALGFSLGMFTRFLIEFALSMRQDKLKSEVIS